MKRLIAFFVATLLLPTLIVYWDEITRLMLAMVYMTASLLIVSIGITGLVAGWGLTERVKMIRVRRIEAEKSAHVMVVSDNNETWVRDTDKHATWRNLTGSPTLYVNGVQISTAGLGA